MEHLPVIGYVIYAYIQAIITVRVWNMQDDPEVFWAIGVAMIIAPILTFGWIIELLIIKPTKFLLNVGKK